MANPAPPRETSALATLADIPEDLRRCLFAHLEKRLPNHDDALALLHADLATPSGAMLAAVLTRSVVEPAGFFARLRNKKQTERVLAIVTPQCLLQAVQSGGGPAMASILLRDGLEVADYASSPMYELRPDHGLTLTGFSPGAAERHTHFLGFGLGADADRFVATLRGATGA